MVNSSIVTMVNARNVFKMSADEDVMMATAGLFLELFKGDACEVAKVTKFLQSAVFTMVTIGLYSPW